MGWKKLRMKVKKVIILSVVKKLQRLGKRAAFLFWLLETVTAVILRSFSF